MIGFVKKHWENDLAALMIVLTSFLPVFPFYLYYNGVRHFNHFESGFLSFLSALLFWLSFFYGYRVLDRFSRGGRREQDFREADRRG